MKHLLKSGEISKLFSDKGCIGWSGEVHLIKHMGKKYVLRKSQNLKRARFYELASKKLEKYGFLPKFLGRFGKNVIFEYIEGRDLTKNEKPAVIRQLGAISAYVNKTNINGSFSSRFRRQIKECISGEFGYIKKMPILSEGQAKKVKSLYQYLKKNINTNLSWDVNDVVPENFRIRDGKVYLVDIESIGTRVKGLGIGKAFIKWFKSFSERKIFLEGYNSASNTGFLTEKYLDFIFLNFLIQELNYTLLYGTKSKPQFKLRKNELKLLLSKYSL